MMLPVCTVAYSRRAVLKRQYVHTRRRSSNDVTSMDSWYSRRAVLNRQYVQLLTLEEQYSKDNTCTHGEGVTNDVTSMDSGYSRRAVLNRHYVHTQRRSSNDVTSMGSWLLSKSSTQQTIRAHADKEF